MQKKERKKHLDTNLFLYWPALASQPCLAIQKGNRLAFQLCVADSF